MNKIEIENWNNLVKLVEHQEVEIFGLTSKVEALVKLLNDISIRTNNGDVHANYDDYFWDSFHSRFSELKEPSQVLRDVHELLSHR